jgi:hypothetical protein
MTMMASPTNSHTPCPCCVLCPSQSVLLQPLSESTGVRSLPRPLCPDQLVAASDNAVAFFVFLAPMPPPKRLRPPSRAGLAPRLCVSGPAVCSSRAITAGRAPSLPLTKSNRRSGPTRRGERARQDVACLRACLRDKWRLGVRSLAPPAVPLLPKPVNPPPSGAVGVRLC